MTGVQTCALPIFSQSRYNILHEEYLPEAILERNFYLDNGKVISRIWIEKLNVSLNNRKYWPEIFEFFSETMTKFELFFYEFEDYIKDLEMNTQRRITSFTTSFPNSSLIILMIFCLP